MNFSEEQIRKIINVAESSSNKISDLVHSANIDPSIDFRGLDMRGADLRNENLSGFNFSMADLSGADLRGADLSYAIGCESAILNNIITDELTKWPLGLRNVMVDSKKRRFSYSKIGALKKNYIDADLILLEDRFSEELRYIRSALEDNQFYIVYQPIVNLSTGCMFRAEALIRWRHPEGGIVSPWQFIPLADEAGLMWDIGAWVLAEACRWLSGWIAQGISTLSVSVNLSLSQFLDSRLVEFVRSEVKSSGIPPEKLELELNEDIVFYDIEKTFKILRDLKDIGVRLSIDNFGTAYSSLAYLRRLPFDTLKIDRSFVYNIEQSTADAAFVGMLINLANCLGFEAIVEGVETQEQGEIIRQQSCIGLQGFLICRPLSVEDFEAYLRDQINKS